MAQVLASAKFIKRLKGAEDDAMLGVLADELVGKDDRHNQKDRILELMRLAKQAVTDMHVRIEESTDELTPDQNWVRQQLGRAAAGSDMGFAISTVGDAENNEGVTVKALFNLAAGYVKAWRLA